MTIMITSVFRKTAFSIWFGGAMIIAVVVIVLFTLLDKYTAQLVANILFRIQALSGFLMAALAVVCGTPRNHLPRNQFVPTGTKTYFSLLALAVCSLSALHFLVVPLMLSQRGLPSELRDHWLHAAASGL